MKRFQSLISGMIACGFVFAMISTAAAQTATTGVATVVRMKGDARYMTANSPWKALKVGDVLKPGSVIQTAVDTGSYVDVVLGETGGASPRPVVYSGVGPDMLTPASFSRGGGRQPKVDQNTIRLTENTALGIDKLTSTQTGADVVTDTQLDLKAGRIFGTVKKMSPASTYEIKLPNGVAGIRGTIFDLSANGVLRVLLGSVGYAYVGPDGKVITKMVGANTQFDSRTGQTSQLSSADIDELSQLAAAMRFGYALRPVYYTMDQTVYYISQIQPR